MIRDVKILKVHLNRHAGWNTYVVYTVQVIWVIAWIPRTCQCVVYYCAAICKTRGIFWQFNLFLLLTLGINGAISVTFFRSPLLAPRQHIAKFALDSHDEADCSPISTTLSSLLCNYYFVTIASQKGDSFGFHNNNKPTVAKLKVKRNSTCKFKVNWNFLVSLFVFLMKAV